MAYAKLRDMPAQFMHVAFQPVSISTLVAFRIIFGLLLCYHFISAMLSGYVAEVFIKPPFTFNFIGFEFLQPLPGAGMYYWFGAMAILALLLAVGAFYRVVTVLLALLWWGVYLMQKSFYSNHHYLLLLLCFIMIFVPANRYCSIDVKRKAVCEAVTCPQWIFCVFIGQATIMYFFAGVAKINADWLSGTVVKILFLQVSSGPVAGRIFHHHLFHLVISYGGLLFDLSIGPLLLLRITRIPALVLCCAFHLFNSFTIGLGIFPYLSIAFALFFLNPRYIEKLLFRRRAGNVLHDGGRHYKQKERLMFYGFILYFVVQLALPLRPLFYSANVSWTEEGHRMSWQLMMRGKRGKIMFKVIDPVTGKTWMNDPADSFSAANVNWIATLPDLIWQYAQRLKKDLAKKGVQYAQVYAISSVSLNGRRPHPLVDSTVNLAAEGWYPFKHSEWITSYP